MKKIEFSKKLENCYRVFGQALPENIEDWDLLVTEIVNRTSMNGCSRFTDGEIDFILANGPYGHFGEVKYLSAVNITSWFWEFQRTGKREIPKNQIAEKAEKHPDELFQDGIKMVEACFERFKLGREVYGANACYDFLSEQGLLLLTTKRKNEYFAKAAENVITRKVSCGTSKNEILGIRVDIPNNKSNAQITESKRLALIDFFKMLVQTQTEINDLL